MILHKYIKEINIKYLIIGIAVPLIGYWGYNKFFVKQNGNTQSYQIVQVIKGDISEKIKALGQTSIVNEQSIRFNQQGKVAKVNVKQGDTVKEGQIIAELDLTDVNNDIKQQELDLKNSQIALQELIKGNEKSQILNAESNLLSLQNKLKTAYTTLDNTKKEKEDKLKSLNAALETYKISYDNSIVDNQNYIKSNQDEIEQAKKNLEQAIKNYELAKKDLEDSKILEAQGLVESDSNYKLKISNAIQELKNGNIDGENLTNNLDLIFGVTDKNQSVNLGYDTYLGAKNTNQKEMTEAKLLKSINDVASYKSIISNISNTDTSISKDTILKYLKQERDIFNELLDMSNYAYDTINNSISSSSYSQSQISTHLSTASSARNTSQSRLSSVISNISNIESLQDNSISKTQSDNTLQKKQQSVDNAKIDMDKAQQTYDNLVQGVNVKNTTKALSSVDTKNKIDDQQRTIQQTTDSYNTQISSQEYDIQNLLKQQESSKASLDEIKKGATQEAIAKSKINIEQKQLMLDKSRKNMEKYQIIAPFDGTIRSIDFKVGDNLLADDTKYVYIQNANIIEVSVLLDQVDVVKVEPGMAVSMNFYSYPDEVFTGKIYQVSGIPQTSNGVTSYEAKIRLNSNGKTFYSGMTQTVEILVNTKKDILKIPSLAVDSTGGTTTVNVINNFGGTESKQIKTGITDGSYIEVTEGLNEGDKIAQKSYSSSSSTSTSSSSSSRGFGGGGGGGMMVPR